MNLIKQDDQSQPPVANTDDFKAMLEYTSERSSIIEEFIQKELKPEIDFGAIKKIPGSKASLLKPGSEKLLSLFMLTAKFERDDHTWEMLGKTSGLLCMICQLIDNKGRIVGEGRGTALVRDISQDFDINKQVKIAEKRAQVDATLRTFALSGRFTQDMEDFKEQEGINRSYKPAPSEAGITFPQKNKIQEDLKYVNQIGHNITEAQVAAKYGKRSIADLTMKQAQSAIIRLKELSHTNPETYQTPSNVATVSNSPIEAETDTKPTLDTPEDFGTLISKIFSLLKELNIPMAEYGRTVKEKYGTSLLKSLPSDKLKEIIVELEKILVERVTNPASRPKTLTESTDQEIEDILNGN